MGYPNSGPLGGFKTFLGVLGRQYTTHIYNTHLMVYIDAIVDAKGSCPRRDRARELESREGLNHDINGPQREFKEGARDVLDKEKGLKEE